MQIYKYINARDSISFQCTDILHVLNAASNFKRWFKISLIFSIDCNVASRFAHTVMTSTALNKANVSQEVFFEVELPKTAFITNFSMSIEGKTYVGEVKEKEKAKKQYEKAVSSGQTAGLVKASGRKMEKFSVSVNIAAHSGVTFTLTYEELLQRRFGNYEIMIRVKPKQLVQEFQIVADIHEPQGIAFLDAYGTFITNELLPLVEKTVTDKKAHVSFSPTIDQQRKCPDCDGTLIDGDFFIKYDVKRTQGIGDVQIVNGYFVHFFAPSDLPQVPKNVIFCIDVSGSMYGKKIMQTKEALLSILKDLPENDYFGIVIFSNDINVWRPYLSQATPENIQLAQKFIMSLQAGGGTNLHDGVIKSIEMLYKEMKTNSLADNSVPMIILLTDGVPNTWPRDLPQIQESIRDAIGGNITLFCLGFGYDVDYPFLDVLAKQNNGLARRIYEDSDAVLQLQGFYDEVASPLLSEVHFNYPDNTVSALTGSYFKQLFNGSEIVVAGRLNDIAMNDFPIEVSALGCEKATSRSIRCANYKGSSSFSSMDLQVTKDRSLTVSLRNSVKFVIILHKVWKKHPYHQDYLGFYTLDSHFFSQSVHGLIGQFYNGVEFEVSEVFPGQDEGKPDALMFVKGHRVVVTRGWQKDFRQDVKNGENVPCWFIHHNGTGLIDGVHTDYIVSGLFKTI
uniref:Inter-alpha-trypsin inhibitor heavy chain H3 n=1 Tax=Electrophorus electricus TaxID=8005 RepID=A0A4W4E808_ELEEL